MNNEKETRQWLIERLEVLSVKEKYQLTAALFRTAAPGGIAEKTDSELQAAVLAMKPEIAVDVVNSLLSLHDYEVCYPAGSYEQLGEYYLRYEADVPATVLPYVDADRVGRQYEDCHPGVFIGDCFVVYPLGAAPRLYDGSNLNALRDDDWSVRLKLASPARPEGVWLRLPDYSITNEEKPGETDLALHALCVKTIQECTLLEARCVLPEIRDLMEQYDDLADLIYDGEQLGFALDERDQGSPDFEEKFAAAMEYENCHTLQAALEIAGDLSRYDFVRVCETDAIGRSKLREYGNIEDPILKGCVDLKEYGASLLEREGYRLNAAETAYVRRGGQALQQTQQSRKYGMTMK